MTEPAEAVRLAQNLARNSGFAVFPCKDDKSPATPHGFKDATRDPDDIAALWHRYPGPLIGVATGTASGISVLDIDVKADEARAWWRQHQHLVPATRTYRTRSGGFHLVFRHRPGVRCATGKPTPGVDTRGDGGYVIWWFAAGLECLDPAPHAPWPAWLSSYFWPPAPPRVAHGCRSTKAPNPNAAIDGLMRCVRDAQEQTRNRKLFWAAKRMADHIAAGNIARAEARRLLIEAAKDAGLPEPEITRTILSAWRGDA